MQLQSRSTDCGLFGIARVEQDVCCPTENKVKFSNNRYHHDVSKEAIAKHNACISPSKPKKCMEFALPTCYGKKGTKMVGRKIAVAGVPLHTIAYACQCNV